MDVDSLLCLNPIEKRSFEQLRLQNEKRNLSNGKSLTVICKTLEESIDSAVHDFGKDRITLNCERITNSAESNNSSTEALGDLIDVLSGTIKELKDISIPRKTEDLNQKSEEMIIEADKDQTILEKPNKHSNVSDNNDISSRYPELFEIFSEDSKSQFSNLSLNSATEHWDSKNVGKFLHCQPVLYLEKKPEKFVESFQRSKMNDEDAEVSSDRDLTYINSSRKEKRTFHQEVTSSGNFMEEILPEKLSSVNFQIIPQGKDVQQTHKLNDCESKKFTIGQTDFMSFMKERSTSDFKSLPIQAKFSLQNKLVNSKNYKEAEVSTKREKEIEDWKTQDGRFNFTAKKMTTNSFDNVPALSSSSILSAKTGASDSSLHSWRTLRDTPRSNIENNFPVSNFNSRSIYELEMESKRIKLGIKRRRLKLKTAGRNKILKKKGLPLNVELVQGDNELKKNRILTIKSNGNLNSEGLEEKTNTEKKQKIMQNKILTDVLDILVEVESNLILNKKLAESIQERYQNSSVLQIVVSVHSIKLLSEGITRCSMNIQNRENNRNVVFGTNELLIDNVLRLKEAVKEENDYLKQQENQFRKHFTELKNKERNSNIKRTTKHTLISNDFSLSLSQKDKIEELITYTVSLIKKIFPKCATKKKDSKKIDKRNENKVLLNRNPISCVKIEEDPQTQIEVSSKLIEPSDGLKNSENNKRNIELNLNRQNKTIVSELRMDPTFNKPNQEPLKMFKKYSNSDEKCTRSSTLVLHGSYNDPKQTSSQVIKLTNKVRCPSTTQPIWKPAGNAKVPIPVHLISRQKTSTILSTIDKKKEKQNEGLTRSQESSRNVSTKESIRNSKSLIEKSATNFKSSDLAKKPDMRFSKGSQKKENEIKSKFEDRKTNFIPKNQQDPHKKNLALNQNIGMKKRESTIKMLKEIIKSTSDEGNENDRKTPSNQKNLEIPERDSELSIRYLKSKNKINSSRSSFASTSMIKQENSNNPSKIEFKIQNPKTSNSFVKPLLKNFAENQNNLSKTVISSMAKLNSVPLTISPEEDKSKFLITSSAKISEPEIKKYLSKTSRDEKIGSFHTINSKSKTKIQANKLENRKTSNVIINSSKSTDFISENKLFQKPSLKKQSARNSSSYLESYIKLNSSQSLVSNNSRKSLKKKPEVNSKKSENIIDSVPETKLKVKTEEVKLEDKNKVSELKIEDSKMKIKEKETNMVLESKDFILDNSEPEQDISYLPSKDFNSCELLPKIVSSKCCQVSLEPSTCSRISEDLSEIGHTEVYLWESEDQSSEDLNANKKKNVENTSGPLLILKEILQNHGLDMDLMDETKRILKLKQKGCSKSTYFNKAEENFVTDYCSKTLNHKLGSLSENNFEELEVKDAINQCSLESFDEKVEVTESQEYFQSSETSFGSLNVTKSRTSYSKYSLCVKSKKEVATSPEQNINVFSQTCSHSKISEESQAFSVRNVYTETEKSDLENLIYTDVEVSCSLENSFLSKKEASTEVSFKTSCYEVETQTKINLKKDAITNYDCQSLRKGDSNEKQKIEQDQTLENMETFEKSLKDVVNPFDISIDNEYENSEFDSFIENENRCRISEESSAVDSSSTEKQIYQSKETKLQNIKGESQKDLVSKLEVFSDLVVDKSSNEFSAPDLNEVVEESEDIKKEEIKNNSKVFLDSKNKKSIEIEKNKTLEEKNSEVNSVTKSQGVLSFLNFDNSCEVTNKIQEHKIYISPQVKSISKLEVTPSFIIFYDKNEKIPNAKEFSKKKGGKERSKIINSKNQISTVKSSSKTKKEKVCRACKNCKGKWRDSLNLNSASELTIYKSVEDSELLKANHDFLCNGTVSPDLNSLSRFMKYHIKQSEKFMADSRKLLPKKLAVATLELATERAQHLYEGVVNCRQCLTSHRSCGPINEESLRGKGKRPFEESHKLDDGNFYLKISAKRKKEAGDILENDVNFTAEENNLRKEDFFQKKKHNFLTIDISNFKSKTLKRTLQEIKNSETQFPVPEIRDVMIDLLEKVEKNLEKENIEVINPEKRDKKGNPRIEYEHQIFWRTNLLPIIYIIGAICSLFFWCFHSFILYES